MNLSTDLLTIFFFVYCVLYNLFLCVCFLFIQFWRRSLSKSADDRPREWPIITILVPALNEENVIGRTVMRLLALPYPGRLEVLIIDDCSDDHTAKIAQSLCTRFENIYLLRRGHWRCRIGKGDALNHGYDHLRLRFPQRDREQWVIGLFDADGRAVEDDLLEEVGKTFADGVVAAAQCGVRIRNRQNLLAALQDVEFATFSYITQTVRDRTSGAVALGGNGQFIRASVLDQLNHKGECWRASALTEDLDIGIRIHAAGGQIRFLNRWVEQEGIESMPALLRQRHRWAWGTLCVFLDHVVSGRLLQAQLPWRKKLDLHYYLSFWIVPVVVLFSFGLSLLHLAGVVQITNRFSLAFLLANSFGFVPMIVMGLAWARMPWKRILFLVPLTVLYAYHWLPVLISAWICILTRRKPQWAKTQRYAIETAGEVLYPSGSTSKEVVK